MIIHRIYADEAIDTSLHQFNGILDNITETNHEELYIDTSLHQFNGILDNITETNHEELYGTPPYSIVLNYYASTIPLKRLCI